MKFYTLYLAAALSVLIAACGSEPDTKETGADNRDTSRRPDTFDAVDEPAPAPIAGSRVILFLGNSLSAGYGIDPELSFPNLLRQRIDTLGWDFEVVNAGLSGETTSGGLRRIDWLLRQPVDILVLELGGNDGLRGIPTEVTRANLQAIIDKTRARYPAAEIVLAGMQIPPNLGSDYTRRFREVYPNLAEKNDVHLIPFLLEGVGGVGHLMQGDGIHPTAEGHRIMAENVWQVLQPILQEVDAS